MATGEPRGLGPWQRVSKRSFDLAVAVVGLLVCSPVILVAYLVATVSTRSNGFFTQDRVGRDGELFKIVKIRTMRSQPVHTTNVTTDADPRITPAGRILRKTKIDELPQLFNLLTGRMSLVGPRPDVPGYADRLRGRDRIILSVRPGITGPATLAFRNEEALLAQQADPQRYNDEVLYPEKVRINRQYVENYSFWKDVKYLWRTLFH